MEFEQHLLVDGSNILHAWPEMKVLLRRDRDAARSQLAVRLGVLHDAERVRVSLVFDGRGEAMTAEPLFGHATFRRFFTPSGMTADDAIEQLVGRAPDPARCVVATDDRAERMTVEALGALGMSAAELAAWVARAEGRQAGRIRERTRLNDRDWGRGP